MEEIRVLIVDDQEPFRRAMGAVVEATRRLTSGPDGPVVVLLSTYDEDQFDLDGCGAAAYVAKAAFGPDRLSAAWADASG